MTDLNPAQQLFADMLNTKIRSLEEAKNERDRFQGYLFTACRVLEQVNHDCCYEGEVCPVCDELVRFRRAMAKEGFISETKTEA